MLNTQSLKELGPEEEIGEYELLDAMNEKKIWNQEEYDIFALQEILTVLAGENFIAYSNGVITEVH